LANQDPWAGAFQTQAPPAAPAAAPPPTPSSDPWATAFQAAPQAAPAPQAADPWATAFGGHTQPKPEPTSVVGKVWDWANSPLLDLTRQGAGPIETGFEKFGSQLTSPVSVALAVGSLGSGLVANGLVRGGMAAVDAAAMVQKVKLGTDLAFLTKYGYDLGSNTIPQLEMNWGDWRAAKTDKDKEKALARLKEFGTESVLNAIAVGLATKGVARDLDEIHSASPKGKAMAHEQYAEGVYNYQEENQVGTAQARQDFNRWREMVPDEKRRIAVTRNIEAGGDPKILEAQARAAEADPALKKLAPEFRDAKQLSDKEIELRDEIRNRLAADLAHLKHHELLPEDGGRPNYMPHKWDVEDLDPETGKPVERTLIDGDRDMLKKRKFESIFEGEQKGVKPTTKDAALLVSDYHERVSNLVAKTGLAEKLAGSRTNDGAPMGAPGHLFPGFTRPRDAAVTPEEVTSLQKAGTLDQLLKSGRIYEVEPKTGEPKMVGEPGLVVADKSIQTKDARAVKEDLEERAFMWKQRDFVPSGLSVWRSVSEAEAKEQPNAIVVYGDAPFPEQAIMRPGDLGIPTDQPKRIPKARVPVYVNPEVAPHLEPMLESTRPKSALIRAFLAVSKETKSDLLALSPFHWATILNRSLESGLNPFGGTNRKFIFMPKDIDYYNLTDAQQRAMHAGVVVSSTRPGYSGYLEEGLASEHDSLINRIPLIGSFNRAIEDRLFGPHGWISSLKFDLFDKLSDELRKSRPALTADQADRISAAQVNNKFGGLNYTVLGRGASTQNTLRALLLAPDFLESSGRSILDVAGGQGRTLLKSLVAFNAAHWLLARGINYLVSGDTHPDAGYAVLSKNGKREYTLRTTLGDFLRFAEKPKDFLANRVNPIGVRAPAEIAAGEDQFGNKVTSAQQFFDTLRQVVPIPAQGLIPTQQINQPSPAEKLLQSGGVGAHKRYSPAETLAQQLQSKRSGEGAALEGDELAKAQLRYKLEDELRTAINARDNQGRVDAIQKIHGASVGKDPKLTPEEASRVITLANKYPMPLQSSVAHLALGDALQVWDRASVVERRALKPIIAQKIEHWQESAYKHTRKENDTVRQQIQSFRFSLAD
jgi:hypothetical protein